MSIYVLLKFCAITIIMTCLIDMLISGAIQNSILLSRFASEFQENEWSKRAVWKWFGAVIGKNTMDFMGPRALFFPVAELIFPLALVSSLYLYGLSLLILPNIIFSLFVILISVIDLRTGLVPHVISIPGIALGILLGLVQGWQGLTNSLLGALINFSVFLFAYYMGDLYVRASFRRKGVIDDGRIALGFGVVNAAALTGAFCGYPQAITATIVSTLLGGIISIWNVLIREITSDRNKLDSFVSIEYADIVMLCGAIVKFVFPLLFSR